MCLDANAALYTEDVMASHFQRLVHFLNLAASIAPEIKVGEYDMLIPEERSLISQTWNQTQCIYPLAGTDEPVSDYPSASCVHSLFEQQAEQRPDAIAVVCLDQQLSYRQLNEQANQPAHYLRALGIGPEKRVGLMFLDRGLI
ncbi:AMP-binding protein [Vibrio sp. PP-XX7]